jgi:hypothetical protein
MTKMRVTVAVLLTLAVSLALNTTAANATARNADSVKGIPGLPSGVPPAATAAEPALPEPTTSEWPFPNNFSRTEGSGLLSGGASLWTDFVYDDHGPFGSPVGIAKSAQVSSLAPPHGGFSYPEGPAKNNGADIFRAAVGYTKSASYWRVDWNTLADPNVPIAEWTFATGSPAPAAGETWPANAGVSSAGIQYALVVSAQHAQLLQVAGGTAVAGTELHTEVNPAAHSFIVRIPTSVLPVSGSWQVHLAAGLANPAGTEFATVPPEDGGLPGRSNVYNVTFRSYQQESELVCPTRALPVPGLEALLTEGLAVEGQENANHIPVTECGNFWMENDQANTLATGDVSKYALTVTWSQLAAKEKTPEPQPTGYSNRWYVSPLSLGEGVIDAEGTNTYTGPTYLGRVQPYAVYVPSTYNPAKPTSLTWILHSLGANLNQYGGVAPTQLQEECEQRESICATTEGFSDGQWYYGQGQVDFWDVWHQLASHYDLNPDTTVMSGYSMGGWASYKLVFEYPELFAQSMPLEGPVICGTRITPPLESAAGPGQCTNDGNSTPMIVNAKWIPYVMTYGAIDELVPFTGGVEQVEAFNKLGYRYYAVLYPAEDHMVFALQNDFAPATSQLGALERVRDPGSFTFAWYPDTVSSALGIGPTHDYWVSSLSARDGAPGKLASLSAVSGGLPEPEQTVEHHTGAANGPTPAITDSLTWTPGTTTPKRTETLTLSLTDVAALTVDTKAAKLKCPTVDVTSDGPATLTLGSGRAGGKTVSIPAGKSTLSSC